ncbi:hypothetical protein KDA_48580 [Dictyobacter alpinus]|uniref:Uncharacterized protein n=1 Tax=Dictyobacter alpinus TaxID=2014873 RepID=A0A402BDE2_9CHLR|nr:hypothetical protein KDA_48580 [Dictyobacter alpinus]
MRFSAEEFSEKVSLLHVASMAYRDHQLALLVAPPTLTFSFRRNFRYKPVAGKLSKVVARCSTRFP